METALVRPTHHARRIAYAALTVLLLAAAILEAVKHGTGYWQLGAFGWGPDVALAYGVSGGLARGQLHPRAVPLYNLLHRFWGPLALGVVAAALLPAGYVVGALMWG